MLIMRFEDGEEVEVSWYEFLLVALKNSIESLFEGNLGGFLTHFILEGGIVAFIVIIITVLSLFYIGNFVLNV